MALNVSSSDAVIVTAAEADIKTAMTSGIDNNLTAATPLVVPASNYALPATAQLPDAPTMARDANRCISAGVVKALRTFPVRLPQYTVSNAPAPGEWVGALIYVSNGANGFPIIAYSDGGSWLRVDTGSTISAT